MHYLSELNILLFLLQVLLLLGFARALGEVFRRWGQPSITAEILVGIILGPTVFGRVLPGMHAYLFPVNLTQQTMLETVAWLGILFFLLKAGLETNFATAWRQRKQGSMLSLCDLTIPIVIAFAACWLLPDRYIGADSTRLIFALFVAVIMTISALPVTARVMQDLRVYRTDLGLLIMSALTINDVAGWIVFALILGFVSGAVVSIWGIVAILAGTLIFAALSLSLGTLIFDRFIQFLNQRNVPEPGGTLTLVCLAGLAGGALTTWIGIHALFGFFIAGIMAGESTKLSEHTRHIFSQMVHAILVPLFFASIGLKLDFVGEFDLLLVAFILVIGISGRYVAAYIGARLIRQTPLHGKFIALAHIPGGEMQIVIGMVALEYQVISETVYVAIVFGAILSSMMAGPMMRKVLQSVKRVDWLVYLPLNHVISELSADSRSEAIDELAAKAATLSDSQTAASIALAIHEREQQMTTALGDGVAIPHARLTDMQQAVIVMARAPRGVEWDAPDGKPVQMIFLILTPLNDQHVQLQILQGVAQAIGSDSVRRQLIAAAGVPEIIEILRKANNGHS